LIGDFDYVEKGKPDILKTSTGLQIDKKGRQVNVHGWYQFESSGHLIDINGHKKFDRS
jgi:hypothetical protein